MGLRTFVDLTEEGEMTGWNGTLAPYLGVLADEALRLGVSTDYRRFPIPDLYVPSWEGMEAILAYLDEALAKGSPAYVHCLGGMGRTGTVVACHLLRHAGRSLPPAEDPEELAEASLRRVVDLRTEQGVPYPEDSPQTSVQFRFVRRWAHGQPDA